VDEGTTHTVVNSHGIISSFLNFVLEQRPLPDVELNAALVPLLGHRDQLAMGALPDRVPEALDCGIKVNSVHLPSLALGEVLSFAVLDPARISELVLLPLPPRGGGARARGRGGWHGRAAFQTVSSILRLELLFCLSLSLVGLLLLPRRSVGLEPWRLLPGTSQSKGVESRL